MTPNTPSPVRPGLATAPRAVLERRRTAGRAPPSGRSLNGGGAAAIVLGVEPAPRPRCRGLTLVEVVAALALMATLLVAVLAIKSGLARRRAAADRQLRAVAVADRLLADWWQDPTTFPVGRSGRADPALAWTTTVVPSPAAARVGGRVVRLDVRDATAVVLSVDVLLPPAEVRR